MWTKSSMDMGESFIVSGMGLCVVFITLIVLALAILILSKIFKFTGTGPGKKEATAVPQASADNNDDSVMAILVAVISDAVEAPVENFRISDIHEVKNTGD